MAEEGAIGGAIKAVKAAAEAVPVAYQDAVQPAAQEFGTAAKPAGKELGEALVTVARVINTALSPLRGLIWGYEQVRDYLHERLGRKLADKADRLITPPAQVAALAIEGIRITAEEPTLREMYVNLLATAMDRDTARTAHPAFVEMIRQLVPDEARLLQFFVAHPIPKGSCREKEFPDDMMQSHARAAKCEHPDLAVSSFGNLTRLGLIGVLMHQTLRDEADPRVYYEIRVTPFGQQFATACLPPEA